MNKKLKSWLTYLSFDGSTFLVGYFGLILGVGWCGNIFTFLLLTSASLNLLSWVIYSLLNVEVKKNGLSTENASKYMEKMETIYLIPEWVTLTTDLFLLICLVGTGHLWFGACALIMTVTAFSTKRTIKKIKLAAIQRLNGSNDSFSWETPTYESTDFDDDGADDDNLRRMGVIR